MQEAPCCQPNIDDAPADRREPLEELDQNCAKRHIRRRASKRGRHHQWRTHVFNESERLLLWYCSQLYAELLLRAGEFQRAFEMADQACAMAAAYKQRAYEVEGLRLKAEALAGAQPNNAAAAVERIEQAILVAQEQGLGSVPMMYASATVYRVGRALGGIQRHDLR
jgi:hypothetical protein